MSFLRLMSKNTDIAVAVGVVGVLVIMLVPMPPIMLDLFLSVNITIALVARLIVFYTERAMDFSVFPSFLLLATLFRLALNVASTRRILLYGDQGTENVGRVIESFGKFVVGGNYVVGFVVFLILVTIQFVVITKGASRIAEVSARFTLDAMPMKQMSIDTDLNAGIISEEEARQRRNDIAREAEFFGSMDGGTKFVRGDAIAGLIITAINLIGGLIIGVLQKGLPIGEAAKTYSLLTVGDGLVSQIPALIISTAAGILMTRASTDGNLGDTLTDQFFIKPRPLGIAAAMLVGLGAIPGLPPVPFFVLAGITGSAAYAISRRPEEVTPSALLAGEEMPEEGEPDVPEEMLKVDRISLLVGFSLVKIARDKIVPRIRMARRTIAAELGLVVPPIRILDNVSGGSQSAYEICIRENVVARYELMPNHYLAMEMGATAEEIEGIPAQEPVSQAPALWIPESAYERAQMAGYLLVDATTVLVTHLSEVIRSHAHELLSHQDVQDIIDRVDKEQPALIKDVRDMLSQAHQGSLNVVLHRVLQNLLLEGIPIRDSETILGSLGQCISQSTDTTFLTENVRQSLSRTICRTFGENGRMKVITLDAEIEQSISHWIQQGETETYLVPEPEMAMRITNALASTVTEVASTHEHTRLVIACSPRIRSSFSRFLAERFSTSLVVLSFNELAPDVPVEVIANVSVRTPSTEM